MPLHRLYILVLLLLSQQLLGQQARHYTFTHYGSSAGIGSNEVLCVTQDEQGYLWIGTTNGLQRFDGVRFKTFRNQKNNPASIPGNYVHQLMMDKKNNLWIQAAGDKVGIFDTKNFTFREVPVKPGNEMWVKNAKGIVQDEYGNIFLVIANLELLTYNEEKNEFSPAHNFIHFPREWGIIGFFQQPGTKKYWIGTQKGLAVFNHATNQLSYAGHNTENEDLISKLGTVKAMAIATMDKQGRLWFNTWKDGATVTYAYNMHTKEMVLNEYSLMPVIGAYHELGKLLVQRDGTIWISGLAVFGRFLEKEKKFELVHNGLENEQSIAYNRVYDLFEDREENIWVATSDNGLYRFTPSDQFFTNVRQVNRMNGKPGDGSMMSFVRTRQGTILAGAWGDGIYHFDSAFNMIPLNIKGFNEKATPSMWGMFASADNNTIWIAAQPGIFRINQDTRTATFYNPAILKERTIRQVAEDKYGNLWIGTQSIGLFKWTKEKGKIKFDDGVKPFKDIDPVQILKLHVDKKGYVWVCTSSAGLYVIDPANDKIVLHLGMKESTDRRLLSDGVASVLEYDDSTMAIVANGLHLYNTRLKKITKTIALPESIPGICWQWKKNRRDTCGFL